MKTHSQQEITELLLAWSDGDQAALGQLAPLVEEELRRLVGGYLKREANNHFLQTTDATSWLTPCARRISANATVTLW
jgi:hypothetical protein